jgi:uncharacterized membrane protein (DUF106 family)
LELLEVLPHVVTGAASVLVTAVTTAFVIGRKVNQAETDKKQLEEDLKELKEKFNEHVKASALEHEKARERHLQHAREASDRWYTMERTLGQIEGMLSPRENPRATRPKLPSRGGG